MNSHHRSNPFRLLVVDDDPLFAFLARSYLKKAGFSVHTVSSAIEALELLDQVSFDALLVDLCMPLIDGFRLIALIRSTQRLRGLPIIVVTQRRDEEASEEALRLGVDAFLSKPVDWGVSAGDKVPH